MFLNSLFCFVELQITSGGESKNIVLYLLRENGSI